MILNQEDIEECNSISDICRKLNFAINGNNTRKVQKMIQEKSLDTSHFYTPKLKYAKATKKCPVCEKDFIISVGAPREKVTCSHACSNTFFRSGPGNR